HHARELPIESTDPEEIQSVSRARYDSFLQFPSCACELDLDVRIQCTTSVGHSQCWKAVPAGSACCKQEANVHRAPSIARAADGSFFSCGITLGCCEMFINTPIAAALKSTELPP